MVGGGEKLRGKERDVSLFSRLSVRADGDRWIGVYSSKLGEERRETTS